MSKLNKFIFFICYCDLNGLYHRFEILKHFEWGLGIFCPQVQCWEEIPYFCLYFWVV